MFGSVIVFGKAKAEISIVPFQSGSLTYTGTAQSPIWNGYDSSILKIGGVTSGTNAGTYTASFTPKEGYAWSDGSMDAKSVTWTINRAAVSVPSQKGSLAYTGNEQSPAWNNYDSSKMSIGGTSKATNAGTYTATFTPEANYQWPDGTTGARSVPWSIGVVNLTVPAQSGSLTYTGSVQYPSWSNYDSSKLTIGGTTSGMNAGTYTATFTPKQGYQWADGTTGARSVSWRIGMAAGILILDKSSLTLDVSNLTGYISLAKAGDGAISATSSNTAVADVAIEDGKVKVTAKAKGSATITVNVAADKNHTAPPSQTCSVTVNVPSTSLDDNTPEIIQAAARAGVASNYWSVGDQIGIKVNGSFGGLYYNGTVYAFILGFNHNSNVEGDNSIHFQFGKTRDGTDIAFVQSYLGNETGFFMNTSNTNVGGWKSSYMRNTICPAFLSALPTAWQNIIVACTKYSDNTGGGNDAAGYVTSTSDKIWLLSELEVFGIRCYANSAEQNYQKQYDYYKNGNSNVKYKHNETTAVCAYWLRSVDAVRPHSFLFLSNGRIIGDTTGFSNHSYGFAPCFKVA